MISPPCGQPGRSATDRQACEMAVTLCIPPRAGELCAPVRFLLRTDSVVMELTARHRITGVDWDDAEGAVAMTVEITDPENARPVDVPIDVVAVGSSTDDPRSKNTRPT